MRMTATVEAAMSLLLCGALLTGHSPQSKVPQGSFAQAKTQSFTGKIVSQNGVRFVLRDDDNNVWYHLDDQEKAGKFFGKDVLVSGTFDGLTGTIRVQSIVESPPLPKPAANIEEPKQNSEPANDAAVPPTVADPAAPATASVKQSSAADQPVSKARAPHPDDPPISAETKVSRKPQGDLSANPTREAPPPSLLTFPEEAVSSSSSIAISSSRSALMPPGFNPETQSLKNLHAGRLLTRIVPAYPSEAIQQRIEGTVRLHALIGNDGQVLSIEPVSGPPLLVEAAEIAVRQWRYGPTLFDGRRVQVHNDIRLVFRLPD
jgi:periplasmic protein TonB